MTSQASFVPQRQAGEKPREHNSEIHGNPRTRLKAGIAVQTPHCRCMLTTAANAAFFLRRGLTGPFVHSLGLLLATLAPVSPVQVVIVF